MAVEFKANMTKAELLEIAAANGIAADDGMTKAEIVAALEAANAEPGAEGAEPDAEGGGADPEGNDPSPEENGAEGAESGAEEAPAGYDLFVYAGPSLPRGRLKENAVFRGTFADVTAYLADVLEDYPQVAKLIVPAHKLAAFAAKVKKPGNIAHKHYNDIVSAMHGNKEV